MAKRVATKSAKKLVEKVIHPPYLKTNIASGEAIAAPPLGPQLGARGIPIGPFCKQFNDQTANLKTGLPLPTLIVLNPDRTVSITTCTPPSTYFLKMAAGAGKATTGRDDIAGKITLKHIYEIAKIKIQDPPNAGETLQDVCKKLIGTAHSCNIQIVKSLEPDEYQQFLEERKVRLAEYEKELDDVRQSKLLRL